MVEHDRIAAVVSLSHAFAAVRGSGDGVLASKLSAEIERNLRNLNPETASGTGTSGGSAVIAAPAVPDEHLTLYTCHKQVHATPMTRGVYNLYRGWTMPNGENGDDAGYLVVYNRGTSDHYESWSPKHIFDEGYSEAKVLTDADALADLNGEQHQDNHSR